MTQKMADGFIIKFKEKAKPLVNDSKESAKVLENALEDVGLREKISDDVFPQFEKFYEIKEPLLPKTKNEFIFAEGKTSEAEKFEFQRDSINTACMAFNNIKSTNAFLDETIENKELFGNASRAIISELDKNCEEIKKEAAKRNERFIKFKEKATGLAVLMFLLAFGFGYLTYYSFTKILPYFTSNTSGHASSTEVQNILLFSYALIFFIVSFGGFIVFTAFGARKNKVSVEELSNSLDEEKDKIIKKMSEGILDYEERNNEMLARFDVVIEKISSFEKKLEELYSTIIGRFLPPIDANTMLRVNTIMEEGQATSYVDALAKAKDQILKEKQRQEDIAREEARHQDQMRFQEEMLASQHRTESYAKEAAASAREQASIASRQLDEMRAEARANSEFRQSQLKQGEKALKQSERALQESRDRYDEFKRNNY